MSGLPSPEALGTLVAIGTVFFLSPGPAVLYIVARSLAGGFAEGVRAAVGLSLGASVHVALTAVGVVAALTHVHAWNSGLPATAGAP